MQELTDFVDSKGDVWTGQCKILKTSNNTAVMSGIIRRKKNTIMSRELINNSHRCKPRGTLKHVGTLKDIHGIFLLSKNQTPEG
jgi:hypothetical protein